MTLLSVEGLTVRFGGLVAVDDLSFVVQPNMIMSIIGPNGAGKTTVLNAITGSCGVARGTVKFKGCDITGWPAHRIARQGVARTFQKTSVFPEMTVIENLITASHCTLCGGFWPVLLWTRGIKREEERARERATEILEFCGLARRTCALARNLAYGEQRMLEIAIALALRPELILLDEPAAGLNPVESQRLMELIRRLRDQGNTIVLVEHDMKLVMAISDCVEVVNYGRKISEGSPEHVVADEQVITAYLGRTDCGDRFAGRTVRRDP